MTRPHIEFKDDHVPLAYPITFRGFGTWLHGDSWGSVDRFHRLYGTPMLPPDRHSITEPLAVETVSKTQFTEPRVVEAVNKFENLVILEWHSITEPRAVATGCKHSTNLITLL
jgi:hypothetical protein